MASHNKDNANEGNKIMDAKPAFQQQKPQNDPTSHLTQAAKTSPEATL